MISVYNTEQHPGFTAIMFNATLRYEFARRVEGFTVTNLYYDKIKEIEVAFPSISEQKKIYQLFSQIDSLIASTQKEHDKLVTLKKCMLQKMFPKEGSLVPEIRFKGFSGDWDKKKLGEMGTVQMCKRIFKEETSDTGDVPFYKIGTFGGEPDSYISKEKFLEYKSNYPFPKNGAILLSASGTIGRTVVYSGKDEYFQDSNIIWFAHNDEVLDIYLKVFYETVNWNEIEGSTIKRLYNSIFLNKRIILPKDISEQQKIGSYFQNLDNLIFKQAEELEKLKNVKKTLLSKMFV